MTDIKKQFGARIKELRELRGYNQEHLAELIDIESRHLSRIETGKSFTTIENLEKIADALEVSIDVLFDFGHEKESDLLLKEIFDLLQSVDDEKLKLVYRVVTAILV